MSIPYPPPPPYPPYAQPPAYRRPGPAKSSGAVVAAAIVGFVVLLAAIGTCTLGFVQNFKELDAAVDASVAVCAPQTGSAATCPVPQFHHALQTAEADDAFGTFQGFTIGSREIQCHNGRCDARVRGRVVFEHLDRATTLDFVEHDDGWRLVSWAPEYREPLID